MKDVYSRGQSLSEYALVLALIFAAVLGMQTYIKRGIQGVIKTTADTLGEEEEGAKEAGLVELEYAEPLAITSLEGKGVVVTEGETITLRRKKDITTGFWNFTYGMGDAGSFSASDKENPDIGSTSESKL